MGPSTASSHRWSSILSPRTPLTAQRVQEDMWDAPSKESFKPCPPLCTTSGAAKGLAITVQKQDEATACRSGHLISPVSDKIIILELDCLFYSPRSHFQWQGEKAFDPLSAFVKDSLLASNSLGKTNTQQFRLEGTFGGHLVQSPAQSSSK